MPWIANMSYTWKLTGPFLIYGIILLIGSGTAIFLPYDTQGRELDFLSIDENESLKTPAKED